MPKRVIVTRPAEQASVWTQALRGAGLDALSVPLIAIGAPPDTAALQHAWVHMGQYDAVMFVSANAVHHFFQARPLGLDAWGTQPAHPLRAFATGPGTVAALRDCGVDPQSIDAPDAQAGQFDSEALWNRVQGQVRVGFRVLIVRGMQAGDDAAVARHGAGRDWFAQQVVHAGGQVDFAVAYQRSAPVLDVHALALVQAAAQDGSVWLFSSSEAVTNLQAICPRQDWTHAIALATHPRIASVARQLGFGAVRESRPAMDELVASIESLP